MTAVFVLLAFLLGLAAGGAVTAWATFHVALQRLRDEAARGGRNA